MPDGNDRAPPPEVQAAADKVQAWLDSETKRVKSPEARAAMTPAEQLDYARQFDQARMPSWRDPRKRA